MLPPDALKSILHKRYTQLVKLLSILATFEKPASVAMIKDRAKEAGFAIPKSWNISTALRRSQGKAVRTPKGWELQEAGNEFLSSKGIVISFRSPSNAKIALNALVKKVGDETLRSYLYEVTKAFDEDMFRSAVVMSWLAAMFVLQQDLVNGHLNDFNNEMKSVYPKFKNVKNIDQLTSIRESEQLVRMQAIGMFSKSIKRELDSCLDRRNSCGHPSDVKYGQATVEHHIEILLNNVFLKRR